MDPELQDIERQLTGMRPAPLSDDLLARLEAVALRIPAVKEVSVDEKIVPFPSAPAREKKHESHRPAWAAAAAVAILGAMTALMIPRGGSTATSTGPVADTGKSTVPQTASVPRVTKPTFPGNSGIVPASLGNPSVLSAQDQGVMSGPNGPMRMMRVVYRESVKVPTEDGRWIEIQQPREEWILVPEKFQ